MEMEHAIVQRWSWSLRELDETDIESLLPFVFYKPGETGSSVKESYCDEVDWL